MLTTCAIATTAFTQKLGDITEFNVNAAQELASITAGADGNLWVIDPRTSKILRITPAGTVTEFQLTPGAYPADITAGPDGNVWYGRRGEVGKITPSGDVTAYKVDGMVSGISAGPDGNLWFCETFRGKIGRCTTTGEIKMFDVPTRPGNGSSNPLFITAGPDGNLWFTESHPGANRVGCITPDGKFSEYPLPKPGVPRGIAAGPDGNLWVAQTANPNDEDRVFRVSTSGTVAEFVLAGVKSSMAQSVVSGADGNLWFTEPNNPSTKVSKISIKGELSRFGVPTAFSGPCGLTVGPDGNLWFSERAKSKIGRLWTAEKDTKYVLHLPSGFIPATTTINMGESVEWINKMPGQSALRRESTPPDLDSTGGTGQHFTYKFNVAGTYRYLDHLHETHKGTVVVPLKVSPASGPSATKFEVTWAAGTSPFLSEGFVIDVEVEVPGKNEFTKWQDGVTTTRATFEAKDGKGEYRFRCRLRHKSGESASDWSPEAVLSST